MPRLSPDGDRVAVSIDGDVWVYYIEQGTRTRLTFDGATNDPVWSPDGSRIAFRSQKEADDRDTFWMRADGGGDVEPLLVVEGTSQDPHSLSRDGKRLAYYEMKLDSHRDIWLLPLEGEKTPEPFLVTPFNERSPSFSPDGRFLAYVSDESGQDEVYVQRLDRSGGKLRCPRAAGVSPFGRETVESSTHESLPAGLQVILPIYSVRNESGRLSSLCLFSRRSPGASVPGRRRPHPVPALARQ